mmetsp:Transcript_35952/g.58170  ORF Transcript_35952/g.58170 Transcript_35952/m.58170 type:complete len:114 (-) Transcript_35952:493-834(-)
MALCSSYLFDLDRTVHLSGADTRTMSIAAAVMHALQGLNNRYVPPSSPPPKLVAKSLQLQILDADFFRISHYKLLSRGHLISHEQREYLISLGKIPDSDLLQSARFGIHCGLP